MLDEVMVDKSGLHRRLNGGVQRLHKRWLYFTPPTDSDSPAETSTAVSDPLTTLGLPAPVTTTSSTTTPIDSTTSLGLSLPGLTSSTTSSTSSSTSILSTSTSSTLSTSSTSSIPSTTSTTPTSTSTSTPLTSASIADATVQITITSTPSVSQSATSAAASSTSSTVPSSGVSTGVIIGGIVAVVIGVAGILFAVIYFIRRSRSHNQEDDDDDFNANAFRRQSMMIPDDDSMSGMSRAMNFSRARPPTMIEQKLANVPVSYNPAPMPAHPFGYGGAYNSYAPGPVGAPYTPTTANSANPFFSPYGESRIGTPVSVPAHDASYEPYSNPVSRQQSVASNPVLSRHNSASDKPLPVPTEEAQYVDMSRSSVTPFQAAQYAEISRRLNTTPPQALPLGAVTEEYEHPQEIPVPVQNEVEPLELQPSISFEGHRLTVQPTPRENSFPESPFADPNMVAEQQQHIPRRESVDSVHSELQPPEPSFAGAPKQRINSIPPMLPEIQIQERPFSPVTLDFPIAPSSVRPSPSPFSTSFSIPSPPPDAHFAENATLPSEPSTPAAAPTPAAVPRVPAAKRPDTVYTMYDDEDAYGGM